MLKSILKTLQSIEGLLMDILLVLKERNERPVDVDMKEAGQVKLNWLEEGIDNIMGYQVGKKRGDGE